MSISKAFVFKHLFPTHLVRDHAPIRLPCRARNNRGHPATWKERASISRPLAHVPHSDAASQCSLTRRRLTWRPRNDTHACTLHVAAVPQPAPDGKR